MKTIENQIFGEERALYGSDGIIVKNCSFDGAEDGESALKESKNIIVENTFCNLRYPFWHDTNLTISSCRLTQLCRAALWYSNDIRISDTELHGIKALRECKNVIIDRSSIVSAEFGWFNQNVKMTSSKAESEYFFMRCTELDFTDVYLKGKYSFQYIKNSHFKNCVFDTKDAFWHAENVLVENCTVNGEYLAWYCKNVTFKNCRISGTQPLCYCENLKLIDCEMANCDLSFENSSVDASIKTDTYFSIKNPASGTISFETNNEYVIEDETGNCSITKK